MPTPPRRGHAPVTEQSASPQPAPQPAPQSQTLYTHVPHSHTPQNANDVHEQARLARATAHTGWRGQVARFNLTIAVWLTQHTGSMACAWLFAGIGVGSLVGVFTGNVFLAALFGSISSYFLQLVLLPVLSVGQNVLSRHAETQADEQFHATLRAVHEGEQVARHLDAQDAELLRQTQMLTKLIEQQIATPPPAAPPTVAPVAPVAAPPPPRRRRAPAISPASPTMSP